MTSFVIKSQTTGPITEATVDAPTREQAIAQTVQAVPTDGSSIAILNATEAPAAPAAAKAPPPQK